MMLKLDTGPVSVTYPTNSQEDMESAHRLIVLVPANINFSAETRRIWELARAAGLHVQLLGLCRDATEESRLRRELITMASLLRDGEISAETKVVTGTNWLDFLTANYEAGDRIVCFAGQTAGLSRRPLSQILAADLGATLYVLPGPPSHKPRSNRLSQIGTWLGLIAVMAGFGLLQAKIVQYPEGGLQNVLLILSLIPEFWLIWVMFG